MEKQIEFLTGWERVILKNPLKAIIFDVIETIIKVGISNNKRRFLGRSKLHAK